jgi:hypothetical protein
MLENIIKMDFFIQVLSYLSLENVLNLKSCSKTIRKSLESLKCKFRNIWDKKLFPEQIEYGFESTFSNIFAPNNCNTVIATHKWYNLQETILKNFNSPYIKSEFETKRNLFSDPDTRIITHRIERVYFKNHVTNNVYVFSRLLCFQDQANTYSSFWKLKIEFYNSNRECEFLFSLDFNNKTYFETSWTTFFSKENRNPELLDYFWNYHKYNKILEKIFNVKS